MIDSLPHASNNSVAVDPAATSDSAIAVEPVAPERKELLELQTRLSYILDARRPEAIAKRHALGLRSARENIEDLWDPGSFTEHGALAFAAQTQRRSLEDLVLNSKRLATPS